MGCKNCGVMPPRGRIAESDPVAREARKVFCVGWIAEAGQRSAALIFSNAAEPGHRSRVPSWFSGVSTVLMY